MSIRFMPVIFNSSVMKRTACFILLVALMNCVVSCKVQQHAASQGNTSFTDSIAAVFLNDKALQHAHVGISIYDPVAKQYLYNHQQDKYFIPASNTKIITCYAAMKHLGDSLVGLRYSRSGDTIIVYPSGDPTLLHRDFKAQAVVEWLSSLSPSTTVVTDISGFHETAWGYGWSWDDYPYYYMAERSALPVYGNCLTIEGTAQQWSIFPSLNGSVIDVSSSYPGKDIIMREIGSNLFRVGISSKDSMHREVPFVTDSSKTAVALLQQLSKAHLVTGYVNQRPSPENTLHTLYSQPADSMLKIMMHRSDNFFAEQSLLMVSNKMLGVMNDAMVIDTLLRSDLEALPQRPQWVDGSGLSRFNLFSPMDFVTVLDQMRNTFDWNRVTTIFPSGGKGTLSGRFAATAGNIYAKTGTLSNNVALSGYIITASGKTLIFSILVNNHMSTATAIRTLMENYVTALINHY